MAWQVQEAKQRFSEVLREAEGGAQMITKHGQEVAVVISIDEYRRLTKPRRPLSDYLIDGPQIDDLDLTRHESVARYIDLEDMA